MFRKYLDNLRSIIVDDMKRTAAQAKLIYMTFAVVAIVMTIVNIITDKMVLMVATGVFAALCLLNFALVFKSKRCEIIARVLFEIEIIILFTFFILTGGTDNFSIIWLLLLPTVGLYFFGVRRGTIMSLIILVIMLVCFHSENMIGMTAEYGETFEMRFPLVFVACYVVSLVLEGVRVLLQSELNEMRIKYEYLYNHDALTGLMNRYGIRASIDKFVEMNDGNLGVAIFDIDHFKNVNDTYGHLVGDEVLKMMAKIASSLLPKNAQVFRWGGEEFAVIYGNPDDAEPNIKRIHKAIRENIFHLKNDKVNITISAGVAYGNGVKNMDDFDRVLNAADMNLYKAKETGRNKIVMPQGEWPSV